MQLPDAAVVLGETADPSEQLIALEHGLRKTLAQYASNFLARRIQARPATRLLKAFDEQRGRLHSNVVGLTSEVEDLHGA
jgi:hypothetical protein